MTAGAAVAALSLVAAWADAVVAQPRRPAPRDTTPARRDSLPGTRRPTLPDTTALDTLPVNSPRRSTPQSAADSMARDSTIARQLREAARTGAVSRLGPLVDRLRLTAVGGALGGAWPRNVQSAALYGVQAEYGALVPWFDVVFTVSYWQSSYNARATRGFADALGRYVGDSVATPAFRASAFTFGIDGRWRPTALTAVRGPLARVRPFVSGGLGVHFPNSEGAPITGTFVEQQLDGIALGLAAGAGTDLVLFPNFQLTMLARYDLYNGAHFASLRAGATYLFERWRPGRRPGRGARGAA